MKNGENETNGELYLAEEFEEPTTPENYIYAECDNNSVSYIIIMVAKFAFKLF